MTKKITNENGGYDRDEARNVRLQVDWSTYCEVDVLCISSGRWVVATRHRWGSGGGGGPLMDRPPYYETADEAIDAGLAYFAERLTPIDTIERTGSVSSSQKEKAVTLLKLINDYRRQGRLS